MSYVPSKPLLWTNQIPPLVSLAFASHKMVAPSQDDLIDNQDPYCDKTGLTSRNASNHMSTLIKNIKKCGKDLLTTSWRCTCFANPAIDRNLDDSLLTGFRFRCAILIGLCIDSLVQAKCNSMIPAKFGKGGNGTFIVI